jgi:hypothetical protein
MTKRAVSVGFRFSGETKQALEVLAADENRSMSNYLETLIMREYASRVPGNDLPFCSFCGAGEGDLHAPYCPRYIPNV